VDEQALVLVVAVPDVEEAVTHARVAHQRAGGRVGVDRVEAVGRLGRVQQLGGAQVADVQEVGDALDVPEEAHAPEGAVVLGLEGAVERNHHHQREDDALQRPRYPLTLHVAVALRNLHGKLALVGRGGKVSRTSGKAVKFFYSFSMFYRENTAFLLNY